MKILVCDDEKLLVKGIKFNLETEGYQVEVAYNGADCIKIEKNGDFDLIILDIMMPQVSGLEACMQIREFSTVPIIMLTAKSDDVDKIIAIDGMCGSGAIGIFLMHYGFEKVIFNDINPKLVEITKDNIITNNIDGNYEILNCPFEDLDMTGLDLCIIDMYPGANIEKIKEKANKIASDVLII